MSWPMKKVYLVSEKDEPECSPGDRKSQNWDSEKGSQRSGAGSRNILRNQQGGDQKSSVEGLCRWGMMKAQGIGWVESDILGHISLKVITQGIKRKQLISEDTSSWRQAVPGFPNVPHSHVHDRWQQVHDTFPGSLPAKPSFSCLTLQSISKCN